MTCWVPGSVLGAKDSRRKGVSPSRSVGSEEEHGTRQSLGGCFQIAEVAGGSHANTARALEKHMVPHPQGQNWHSVTGIRNTHTTTTQSRVRKVPKRRFHPFGVQGEVWGSGGGGFSCGWRCRKAPCRGEGRRRRQNQLGSWFNVEA